MQVILRSLTLTSIFIILSIFKFAVAQNAKLDSIQGTEKFNKAIKYYQKGNLDSAAILFEAAAPFMKRAKLYSSYIDCFNALHNIANIQGNFTLVRYYSKKSWDSSRKYLQSNVPAYGRSLQNYGNFYIRVGLYTNAIEHISKGVKVTLTSENPNMSSLSVMYSNLGAVVRLQGDYEEALRYYRYALDLRLANDDGNEYDVSTYYRKIGRALIFQQKYSEAATYYLRALKILNDNFYDRFKADFLDIYNQLAIISLEEDSLGITKQYIEKGQEIIKSHPNVMWKEAALIIQGKYYLAIGDFEGSANALALAFEAYQTRYKNNKIPSTIASVHTQYARLYLKQRDYEKAIGAVQGALQVLSPGFEPTNWQQSPVIDSLIDLREGSYALQLRGEVLAAWYATQPDNLALLKASHDNYQLLLSLFNRLRQSFQHEGSKLFWASHNTSIYEGALSTAYQLYEKTGEQHYSDAAFALIEQSRGMLLYEAFLDTKAKFGLPDSLREKESILDKQIFEYSKALRSINRQETAYDSTFLNELRQKRFELEQARQALAAQLEKDYPDYYRQKYATEISTVSQVQALLKGQNMAFISYFTGDKAVYAYRVTQDGGRFYQMPRPAWLNSAILGMNNSFENFVGFGGGLDTAYINNAYKLYEALLAEPLAGIGPGIQRLVLVPEGILNYVPFQALLTQKPKDTGYVRYGQLSYLMRQYAVSYKHSATYWVGQIGQSLPESHKAWVGFASDYKREQFAAVATSDTRLANLVTRGDDGWQLPFARHEVELIGEMMKGKLYTGPEGTEASFYKAAGQYSVIHLANHGLVNPIDPELNNLVFTQMTTDSTYDGKLHAYEVYGMRLDAEMAVLSACNTGMGKLQKGEGVMSLARAFAYAGCRSLVMSLWQVPDKATAAIMVSFYEALLAGQPKDIAMQSAQLAYINNQDEPIFAHPYFWASFAPMGSMKPLFTTNKYALAWGVGIGALFLALVLGIALSIRKRRVQQLP